MSKYIILLYGVFSYFLGVLGLACIIGALAGLIPYGFLTGEAAVALNPIGLNAQPIF